MRSIETLLVWALFLGTSVFGHVALKRVTGHGSSFDYARVFSLWREPWAIAAMIAWALSCLLWALLLTRYGVVGATNTSALRYALVIGAAVLWLGEPIDWRQIAGCLLIVAGIWLTGRTGSP